VAERVTDSDFQVVWDPNVEDSFLIAEGWGETQLWLPPRVDNPATRHTAATLMLNNRVPLEVVSGTLGPAGLAITADVYAKLRPELQRTAADATQQVLGQGRSS
jgi:integrase